MRKDYQEDEDEDEKEEEEMIQGKKEDSNQK